MTDNFVTQLPKTTNSTLSENVLETVALNLSAARIGIGLSQDQLAEAAKVSRATIVQLEGGAGDPRLSTLAAIAAALGITPVLLLIGRDELNAIANMTNNGEAERIREHLSDEEQEEMRRLLRSGLPKNRGKAVNIGTNAATAAGLVVAGAVAGSAIGSALLPGIGTVIGAALGSWLSRSKSTEVDNK